MKAAQVVQHGFCSQYVSVPQLDASTNAFQTITDTIFTSFVNSIQGYKDSCGQDQVGVDVCGFGVPRGCLLKFQEWAHVMPFIRQSDEVTSEQHGGFVFNGAYRLEDENGYYTEIGNGGVGDNYVKLNIAFEWDLTNEGGTVLDTVDGRKQKKLDGRLTARAIQATSDHSGGGAVASQLEQSLVSGIEKQVGDAVYGLTDQRFVFAGAPPFPFSCKPRQVRCDGSVANATVDFISNWQTISPQQADGLPCGDFVTMLRDAVQSGGTIEGLSQDQINEVFEEMFSSHDNVFDYLRCASNPDPSTSKGVPYRCEYPFPMKRINVLPDQLEFVLLDNDDPTGGRELGNRAYGVYLATIGLSAGQPASAANEQVPCQDPRVPAGSIFVMPSVTIRRPFTYYVEGGQFVDRQSSALTCDGCKLLGSVGDFLNGFGALASYF